MKNRAIVFNLLGSILDKGLPILITFFLTNYMLSSEYGKWSYFFAFLLLVSSFITSPVLTIFARKFYSLEVEKQKMHIYFYKIIIIFHILSFGFYYFFMTSFSNDFIFEILSVIFVNIYSYTALFCRFKQWDNIYLLHSLLRVLLFGICVVIGLMLYKTITYRYLLACFVICHLPSFLYSLKYLSKSDDKVNKEDILEFFHLSIYGMSTSLTSSIDRFIIVGLVGGSMSYLGYYSFIYTIVSTPNIIIEALKKTTTPRMFREWAIDNQLSKETKIFLKKISFFLFFIQLIIPILIYYSLLYLNFINAEFIKDGALEFILILSIGLYFNGLYNFVNPVYFFFKKSIYLLYIQVFCMVVYFLVVNYFTSSMLDTITFSIAKTILFTLMTLLTFLLTNFIIKKADNKF